MINEPIVIIQFNNSIYSLFWSSDAMKEDLLTWFYMMTIKIYSWLLWLSCQEPHQALQSEYIISQVVRCFCLFILFQKFHYFSNFYFHANSRNFLGCTLYYLLKDCFNTIIFITWLLRLVFLCVFYCLWWQTYANSSAKIGRLYAAKG